MEGEGEGDAPREFTFESATRILEDAGAGFAMGAGGGTFWHGYQGWKNSPRHDYGRTTIQHIRMKAPGLGVSFAMWTGCFSGFGALMDFFRGGRDHWTPVYAGGLTGAALSIRSRRANRLVSSTMLGAALLGAIELLSIGMASYGGRGDRDVDDYQPGFIPSLNINISDVVASMPQDMVSRQAPSLLIDPQLDARDLGFEDELLGVDPVEIEVAAEAKQPVAVAPQRRAFPPLPGF